MKKSILISVFILLYLSNIRAQINPVLGDLLITDTLELSPLHPWIEIPDPTNNVWQVGSPQKSFFNVSYQNETPILTDTINTYPININQYFQITFPIFDSLYGEVNLSFYHKYDTDSLIDGGIIELSYDGGISWINIKNDIDHYNYNFINIPLDTIKGGDFGFSGRSEGWQYCELYWLYILGVKDRDPMVNPVIRFRFISDEIQTNKEGWMIDQIVFRGYEIIGAVDEFDKKKIQIFPNPSSDIIQFYSPTLNLNNFHLSIFDVSGKIILKTDLTDDQTINIADLQSGIYFYKLICDNEIQTGKIIKQ